MYKDIISYELAENMTEEQLFKIARAVVDLWMSKQKGFLKWEINKDKEGKYVDLVYWENKKAAEEAEKKMQNIPNAAEWFACYKAGSISSRNIEVLASF